MQDLVAAGLAARIGVSNFSREQIDALGEPRPFANQIPCWPPDPSQPSDVVLLGYSPLEREMLESTPAPVILRSLIERGIHPITSSINPAHIRESLSAIR